MWDEIRERDGRVFGVLIQSCASCKSCPDSGGGVTLCADLPGLDPTVPQKIYFEMTPYRKISTYLTLFESSLPGLNFTTFLAGI